MLGPLFFSEAFSEVTAIAVTQSPVVCEALCLHSFYSPQKPYTSLSDVYNDTNSRVRPEKSGLEQ